MAGHSVKQPRKIMADNALGESVLLIGHDAQLYACAAQRGKQGGDAGIRSRRVLLVRVVIREKQPGRLCLCSFVPVPGRKKTLDQLGNAVAHHVFVFFFRMGRKAHFGQRMIGRGGKIADGVQQRAVKIEYHSSVQKNQLLSRMRIKRGAVPAQRRKSTVTPLTA